MDLARFDVFANFRPKPIIFSRFRPFLRPAAGFFELGKSFSLKEKLFLLKVLFQYREEKSFLLEILFQYREEKSLLLEISFLYREI